jgi:phosphatidylserine decarboxylase
MTLTRYGRREWLTATIVALAAVVTLATLGWWWAIALPALLWLAVAVFFRDPARVLPTVPKNVMLSPADGVVSAIEQVEEHEATGGPATIVRIFLSVLDVHVNRAPCDARVVAVRHQPGKYLNAQTEESARVNESNLITLRLDDGATIGVRQVAGMIARRIVCPLAPGDCLARGQKFGMIKFGSTTELIVPRAPGLVVHVRKGERVRGGLTQILTRGEAP